MTFGDWRGILFADWRGRHYSGWTLKLLGIENLTRGHRVYARVEEPACRSVVACSLTEVGDFLVEVGEGGFEGLAMVGVGGVGEVVGDSRAR
jgi:hypothetical protein